MYVTTVMVVLLIGWSSFTILTQPKMQRLPPAPAAHNLTFNDDAVGWMPSLLPHSFQQKATETPTEASAATTETPAPHYGLVAKSRSVNWIDWNPDGVRALVSGDVRRR